MNIKQVFEPFGKVDKKTYWGIVAILSLIFFLIFEFGRSPLIPTPTAIGTSLLSQLGSSEFYGDLMASLTLTLIAMGKSIFVTMLIVYAATIPFFRPIAEFISKCRYLTLTGLVFIFTVMTKDMASLKMSLLMFGIVPFFVTSFLSVVMSIPQIEIDKARVNRKNKWETLLEVVIIGKVDSLFEVIRQNFAIAWMMITTVEAYDMAGGGLGTMLLKKNKVMELAPIFSTVIIVLLLGLLFDYLLSQTRLLLFPYIEKKK